MLLEGIIEVLEPVWWQTFKEYHFIELIIIVGLFFGVYVLSCEVRVMQAKSDSLEEKLKVASGSFNKLLEAHYDAWGLTSTERDVARMILKGCSNAEIAESRSTATGTIKSQTHSIYSKSNLSGKNQFMSFLLEELTEGRSVR